VLTPFTYVGISCPHRTCNRLIGDEYVRNIISPSVCEEFEYVLLDQTINQDLRDQLTRCPLGCGSFLQEDCYCVNEDCRKIQRHQRELERKRRTQNEKKIEYQFSFWSVKASTKHCPKCFAHIEKNGGCDHMNCYKCKQNFLWSQAKEFDPQTRAMAGKTDS